MAVKKSRPALIELIDRGNTSTPGWFYGKKKSRLQQLRKRSTLSDPRLPAIPADEAKTAAKPVSGSAPIPVISSAAEPAIRSAPKAWFELTEDKLVLSLSYWKVLPLVVLGLILTLLIAYRLGQGSVSGTNAANAATDTTANTNIDTKEPLNNAHSIAALGDSSSQEVRKDQVGDRTAAVTSSPTENITEKVKIEKATANKTMATISPPQTGLCLIMCGHRDKTVLEPVRRYFNDNGLATVVGLYGRGYVLVHARSVQKTTSPEAAALQQRVIKLGNQYEQNKPRGAAGFAAAWKSPYFVRTSDVQF